VSEENVEIVLALQPAAGANMAQLFRDDLLWAAVSARLVPSLAPEFAAIAHGLPDTQLVEGVEGLRKGWLQWMAPWESYRAEVEEAIDLGEKVVLLIRDFGRRATDTHEVAITSAAIWTLHEGKVARVDFYVDRAEALKAVGLEE
jgi:ketosteroid isomerase-like protein